MEKSLQNTTQNNTVHIHKKNAKIFNYADDTSSSLAHKDLEFVKRKLEEDADAILSYVVSSVSILFVRKKWILC